MVRSIVLECVVRQQMNVRHVVFLLSILNLPLVYHVLLASQLCLVVVVDLLYTVT